VHHCSLCSFFCSKQDALLNHMIRRHQHDAGFIAHCSVSACGLSFRNFRSFKTHVMRCHQIESVENVPESSDDSAPGCSDVADTTDDIFCSDSVAEAAYILALKSQHRLSQNAVRDICESTKELFRTKLSQLNPPSDNCESIVDSMFAGLESHYKQEKFFKNHFGYVRPCSHRMGSVTCSASGGKVVTKHRYGYFVPLKDQLHALLSMPEVQQSFECVHTTDYIYDFCDADYLRRHPLQSTSLTLNLCLYTDDFEVVNAIGAHKKKHKITAFYWTLLNIPPEYRSKLSVIQLLALARTCDIRKCGVDGLLQDFKSTMIELHDGITFCIDGYGVKTYKGFLVCVLADTPAAQLLGGFKEGVGSAVSPCRSCDVKRSDLPALLTSAECPMRDKEEHSNRVQYLANQNKRGCRYWSKHWGVNGPSVLSDIPGFDITKCMLHDPMHVILEGIGKVELKKMLNIFVFQKKYFTIDVLNKQIQNYTFSDSELKDKPEVIDRKSLVSDSVIPQTAAAMRNLLTNFPFIVGDLVPEDDEHWQTFIVLLQILVLCVSPVISLNTADVLECLIAKHNRNFVLQYSESSFTPKFHYLVHFPTQMRLFGPLHNHMCLRFESKNGFFKLQRWFNFKNLPKSLSFYHQRWMCMQMMQSTGIRSNVYLYAGDAVNGRQVVPLTSIPEMQNVLGQQSPAFVMCSKRVVVNGITYQRGSVLLQSVDGEVVFVKVERIVVHEQLKYLICRKLEASYFDTHRNAFVVEECDRCCVLLASELCYKWPQLTHRNFVMMKNVDDIWML